MMGIRRNWLLLPVLLSAVALATPSFGQTTASTDGRSTKSKSRVSPQSNGHVYLLRGLLNIFSLGMDDLAAKIQAKGISASVHNHSEWQSLADDIAAKYKARQHGPVVLVGHSLGADAVMFMAEYLGKKGVPVALVVPFDGTGSFAASSNVSQVYNLTQRDYAHMRKGRGFRGTLQNVDVSGQGYGHIDIDKSARLHALVLGRIQSVIRTRGGSRTAGDAPRERSAAPAAGQEKPAAQASPAAAKPSAEAASTAKPAADSASVVPATTATTASASASVGVQVSAERGASAPPKVSQPATVPTASTAKRKPTGSESSAKPALRF